MLRLCELTGLSIADITEITSFFMFFFMFCVFVGCMMFHLLREFLELIGLLLCRLINLVRKHIAKK